VREGEFKKKREGGLRFKKIPGRGSSRTFTSKLPRLKDRFSVEEGRYIAHRGELPEETFEAGDR